MLLCLSHNIDFETENAGNGWTYDKISRTYFYVQDAIPSESRAGNGTSGDQAQFGATINPPTGFASFAGLSVTVTCAAANLSQLQSAIRIPTNQSNMQVWIRNVFTSSATTGVGKISAIARVL